MGTRKNPNKLEKFIGYVLERRPDEFGLVPDEDGFVRIKDLLIAICEDPEWKYVRRSHINEIFMLTGENRFLIQDDRIKGLERQSSACVVASSTPPKNLYHAIRRRAYPVILEKGIVPQGSPHVWLTTTEELALRIGKRRDPNPVIVIVHAQRAYKDGVEFSRLGDLLYLTKNIAVEYFSGPALPKEKEEVIKPSKKVVTPIPSPSPVYGGFFLDMDRSEQLQKQKQKGLRKDIEWKREARKARRARKGRPKN